MINKKSLQNVQLPGTKKYPYWLRVPLASFLKQASTCRFITQQIIFTLLFKGFRLQPNIPVQVCLSSPALIQSKFGLISFIWASVGNGYAKYFNYSQLASSKPCVDKPLVFTSLKTDNRKSLTYTWSTLSVWISNCCSMLLQRFNVIKLKQIISLHADAVSRLFVQGCPLQIYF